MGSGVMGGLEAFGEEWGVFEVVIMIGGFGGGVV